MPTVVGKPLRSYAALNLQGGLNIKESPNKLATFKNLSMFLTVSRNTVPPHAGGVSTRPDVTAYNSTTLGASVKVIGGGQHRHSNGTNSNLCATNNGRVHRLNTDGTTTTLKTGLSTASQATFRQFNDLMIYTDRVNAPQSWDGTTWQALAGTPPGTGGPHDVHGGRVHMLDATNVRRDSWSKLGDGENYTAAGDAGSFIVTGRLSSPLVAILAMTNELLMLHRDFVTRLQGTSPTTFALTNAVPAQVSMGCISALGAVFGNNDAHWISQRGIHAVAPTLKFGDYEERFESTNIDPYFLPNSGVTLSLDSLPNAAACYDTQNNRLYFAVDSDGNAQNDMILCLDVATQGWSVWTGTTIAAHSMWTAYTGANGIEVFFGGYDGFVRRLNPSGSTNAIDMALAHISNLGMPFWQKTPRHIYVYLAEQSAGTLTVTTSFDYGAAGGQAYSVSMLAGSALLGSTFVLGSSVLGGRSQIVKRLDTTGLGEFMEITFSNAQAGQPVTVYGYEVEFRERRKVARAA